jgi:UDP-N-acetyl-2-amino-2-deoxyglucuronate dehydrogenase
MKIWKTGIIGAGLIADFHARAVQSLPNARLTGFCGTNMPKVRALSERYECKAYESAEAMLDSGDVDIVTIATPSGAHMEPAILAAEYGKHVICEKPLEISLERIDAMIAAHKSAGTRIGGIFNFRFNESTSLLREAVENKRFGKITCASVYVPWWRNESYYENSWHGTLNMDGGGALMNQAIHMIDMLQYLMGPIESLQAFTGTLAHNIEAEDTGAAVLRFSNKALGIIYGTTASWPGQFRRLEITGTKGTVVQVENSFQVWQFTDQTERDNEILKIHSAVLGGGGVSDPAAIPFEPHARNIAAFLDAVENDKPFGLEGPEARKAVEIVLAIYSSARTLKPYFFS